MVNGAQTYANGAFPASKIKNHPIDFSKFLVSLVDIKRAAQSGGVYLNQAGKTGWRITSLRTAPSPPRPARARTPSSDRPADLHAGDDLPRAVERRHLHGCDAIVSGSSTAASRSAPARTSSLQAISRPSRQETT